MPERTKLSDTEMAMRRFQMEPMALVIREVVPISYAERVLLAAILRRAAFDIALYKKDRRLQAKTLWQQAHSWVYEEVADNKAHPFDRFMSFSNLCMLLNKDPDVMRKKISRLTKKDVRHYDMVDSHGRV